MTDSTSGLLTGAAMGSQFGPIGTAIGAMGGAFFGRSLGKKRRKQELKILKANVTQSYSIGEGEYANIDKMRTTAANDYAQNVATGFAKYAAGGQALTDEARNRIIGSNALTRDAAVEKADIAQDKFNNSSAFAFIKQDYDLMSRANSADRLTTQGITGESFYTDEQKSSLLSASTYRKSGFEPERPVDEQNAFETYRAAVTPTFEQYQSGRFGTDEEKAAFESSVTDRITAANQQYGDEMLLIKAEKLRTQQNDGSF